MAGVRGAAKLSESRQRQAFAREFSKTWPDETKRLVEKINQLAPTGIFATGIENSDPYVGTRRRNQLKEAFDFDRHFEARLENIRRLGITWLRFGVGYSLAHPAENSFDFSLSDKVIKKCDQIGITIIADLLHFGLPDWLHADCPDTPFFQNPDFPAHFARYVTAFTERYPNIRYFTPVNEPFVTARLSAQDGYWNEQVLAEGADNRAFVRAVANIAKAAVLAKKAVETVWQAEKRQDEPIFFQNESFEFTIAAFGSGQERQAETFNTERFAATDLIFGHHDPKLEQYLVEQGLPQAEYDWFMAHGNKLRTVFGIDYYPWSVNQLDQNGRRPHDPHLSEALYVLAIQYYQRYQMPLLHTEVNALPELAVDVCLRTHEVLGNLREIGYPILGMSWFGDDLQIGWQSALLAPNGDDEFRVGLFYKGKTEPVGQLFSRLAKIGLPPLAI